jgi:hypothetical protein
MSHSIPLIFGDAIEKVFGEKAIALNIKEAITK